MKSTCLAPKFPGQKLTLLQNSYRMLETTNIELLNKFKKFNPNGHKLICSCMSIGTEYDNELLIVGKNPSCWRESFSIKELYDNGAEYIYNNKVRCPDKKIDDPYPPNYFTNPRYDPFWDCIEDVVGGLYYLETKMDCPDLVAITNLYKIAYSNKTYLSEKMRLTQFELCKMMFQFELTILKPKRVLFLTGMKYAREFLGLPQNSYWDNKICSIRDYDFGLHNAHAVVTVNPKKCRHEILVREIIDAFEP